MEDKKYFKRSLFLPINRVKKRPEEKSGATVPSISDKST
jgi:hypothetical protein